MRKPITIYLVRIMVITLFAFPLGFILAYSQDYNPNEFAGEEWVSLPHAAKVMFVHAFYSGVVQTLEDAYAAKNYLTEDEMKDVAISVVPVALSYNQLVEAIDEIYSDRVNYDLPVSILFPLMAAEENK